MCGSNLLLLSWKEGLSGFCEKTLDYPFFLNLLHMRHKYTELSLITLTPSPLSLMARGNKTEIEGASESPDYKKGLTSGKPLHSISGKF